MKQNSESEQALNSLDGIQRAAMPEALRQRIIGAVNAGRTRVIALSKPLVFLLAASLALLIGFNIYTLIRQSQSKTNMVSLQSGNPVADEYFTPAPSI